jgi:hypothetical protein
MVTLAAVPLLLPLAGPVWAAPENNHDKVLIAKKVKQKKDDSGYWQHDMNSALYLAQQQNKLVFVDIGAPW